MKTYLIRATNSNNYKSVIYSTSYMNPFDNLVEISKDLKDAGIESGEILFDLLLCNGQSFNRFAKCFFNGEAITYDSVMVVEMIDNNMLVEVNSFYLTNRKILSNGILTSREIFRFFKQVAC